MTNMLQAFSLSPKWLFDTVDHDVRIKKLKHYHVRDVAKDWFILYWKGRK